MTSQIFLRVTSAFLRQPRILPDTLITTDRPDGIRKLGYVLEMTLEPKIKNSFYSEYFNLNWSLLKIFEGLSSRMKLVFR